MDIKRIGVDIDLTIFSFPSFFRDFFDAFQSKGVKVGIVTANHQDKKSEYLDTLEKLGIKPDFFIGFPEDNTKDAGTFKGNVCKDLKIDVMFDDFHNNDPKMLADFFAANDSTIPISSWGYRNRIHLDKK
jgi:hypothetical protein